MDEKLKLALTAAKGAVHNFVIVAKGPTVVFLLVRKTPIKDAEVQAAKKEHAGNAVMRGKCQGQEGELVFRVAKDPTVDDKKLKEFITKATNLPVKPRFEVVTDEDVEGEGDEGESEQPVTGTRQPEDTTAVTPPVPPPPAPPPPVPPPAPTGDAAAFATRLKALKTDLDMVRAAETSVTAEVKTLSAEVGGLAGKKQFAEASKVLDRLEPLVKKGVAELSAPKGEGQPPGQAAAAVFAGRLKTVRPEIDKALLDKSPWGQQIKVRASEMSLAVKKGDFSEATGVLDQIEKLLKEGPSTAPTAPPTPGKEDPKFSIVQLQKSRLAWDGLRKSVLSQLQGLESAILAGVREYNADETAEEEFDEAEVNTSVKKLYSVLEKLDERLLDKLDEALNAKTEELRRAKHAEAAKLIKEYQAIASSDPILASIDANGFAKTTIASAVSSTLADLASKF
jgi:hypothetical protein